MISERIDRAAPPEADHRVSFFRDSGWLMIANVAGGILMWAVHLLAKSIGPAEYGVFLALLALALFVPTMPLQMVLAQQTASALACGRERQLSGIARLILYLTTALWLIAAVVIAVLHRDLLVAWKMKDATGLWITLPAVLLACWLPLFWGVLQGQQNFLWLGWSMITSGVGRLSVAVIAVVALGAMAAGMMTGVLIGLFAAGVIAFWKARSIWLGPSEPFDWGALLRQIVPLMVGFMAFQFLFTADTLFAKAYFSEKTVGFYGAAGTMARALMWLVGPLVAVMFPGIVHSVAKAEKTNLLGMVLLVTAALSIAGAIGLSVLGPWIIRFVYDKEFVAKACSYLPWYAGAMVPLTLANVLVNNLLARNSFKLVPALCVLAAGYGVALTQFHKTPVMLLQTLGVCNLLLLLACAWYTWRDTLRPA